MFLSLVSSSISCSGLPANLMTIKRIPMSTGLLTETRQSAAPSAVASVPGLEADPTATQRERHHALNAGDGTRQLLLSGFWTILVGLTAGLLTVFLFGGVGPQGAHTNAGWLSLMVAMMSTPFAILLLLLGGAKWLRNLGLSRVR